MPYATLWAWYDALVLDGESCLWCATLGGVFYSWLMDDCYTWRLCWWLDALVDGGFALMVLWWWRLCFVGDLVDGGFATLMIWRQCLFYTLPVSWSLPPLRVGFLKPLLVGSKRTLAGSSRRVGTLTSVGAEWSEKIEVFHITTTIVSNGFYQYTIEFSIHIWCLSSMWLIYCYDALMINKRCL